MPALILFLQRVQSCRVPDADFLLQQRTFSFAVCDTALSCFSEQSENKYIILIENLQIAVFPHTIMIMPVNVLTLNNPLCYLR